MTAGARGRVSWWVTPPGTPPTSESPARLAVAYVLRRDRGRSRPSLNFAGNE
jgi:hypothetical protein